MALRQDRNNFLTGLTSQEAQKRLTDFGLNILPEKPPLSSFLIFLDQFKSPLVYVLLFAAGVTLFLRDFPDTAIILLAVFINTTLGFYQERKASRALIALKKVLIPKTWVLRDGKRQFLETKFLVSGDLVFLSAGDKIPADGILTESFHLSLNEAILTGEASPVSKKEKEKVFAGTEVLTGRAVFKVEETGKNTQIGEIAEKLTKLEEEKTPLELRLSGFARQLAFFVAGSTLFIFLTGVLLGKNWTEMFTTAVAIAVAAIPEGLVVSLTVILAIGMQRILSRKALVRRLLAAETLGSVTVIAADKTGTLTLGEMKVVKTDFIDKVRALEACVLANNLTDPLEVALWEFAQAQNHFDPQKLVEENKRIDEWPFSPEKRFGAYLYEDRLLIAGAPEVILEKSEKDARDWQEKIERWTGEGLRVIGFAEKQTEDLKEIKDKDLDDFTFLGLVGFADPIREGVKEALEEGRGAGVKIKVITGDFRATSEVVLAKLGIKLSPEQIMEGRELESIPQEELVRKIDNLVLFARVTPSQKFKIVEALKEKGEVVAILGDGVNDALALKRADIGVVVGSASEVAKENADLVLLDSNFATILAAIEEGRAIFTNIKKIILYLLSDAFSELVLIFGALILAIPLPLTAGQILWINLLTDGFPNLALTVEPKEKNLLKRSPIDPKIALLDLPMKTLIVLISLVTGLTSLLIFIFFWQKTGDLVLARTVAFTALGVDSLLYVFSVRTLGRPLWQDGIFKNSYLVLACLVGFFIQILALYTPLFQKILRVSPLGIFEWGVVILASILVILLIEVVKLILGKRKYG